MSIDATQIIEEFRASPEYRDTVGIPFGIAKVRRQYLVVDRYRIFKTLSELAYSTSEYAAVRRDELTVQLAILDAEIEALGKSSAGEKTVVLDVSTSEAWAILGALFIAIELYVKESSKPTFVSEARTKDQMNQMVSAAGRLFPWLEEGKREEWRKRLNDYAQTWDDNVAAAEREGRVEEPQLREVDGIFFCTEHEGVMQDGDNRCYSALRENDQPCHPVSLAYRDDT